jgi:hypothetical protein
MISVVEGGTAAMMPSQSNGRRWSWRVSTPAGIDSREMPWNPSHPAMKSHSSRSFLPLTQ